jgi:tetratricopeptide (TPR) repeat protein
VQLDPSSIDILATSRPRSSRAAVHRCGGDRAPRDRARRTYAKAWFILALALQPQGRMLEALDAATRAAGLAPEQEGYAGVKAQLENGIGAPDRARRTLETALARMPMSTALRFELASVLEYKLASLPTAAARTSRSCRSIPRTARRCRSSRSCAGALPTGASATRWSRRYRARWPRCECLSPFAFLSLPSTRAEQRACARNWTLASARSGRRIAPAVAETGACASVPVRRFAQSRYRVSRGRPVRAARPRRASR